MTSILGLIQLGEFELGAGIPQNSTGSFTAAGQIKAVFAGVGGTPASPFSSVLGTIQLGGFELGQVPPVAVQKNQQGNRPFLAAGSIAATFQSPPATGTFTDTGSITVLFRANFAFVDDGKITATFTGLIPITTEGFTAAGNIVAMFLNGRTNGWVSNGSLTAQFLPRVGQAAGCVTAGPPPVKPPNAAH